MTRMIMLTFALIGAVAGCRTLPLPSGAVIPATLDGTWTLSSADAARPACLTIADGAVTRLLTNCSEPAVLSGPNLAASDGSSARLSYTSVAISGGHVDSSLVTLDGVFQDASTVVGTLTVVGSSGGKPVNRTTAFVLSRE